MSLNKHCCTSGGRISEDAKYCNRRDVLVFLHCPSSHNKLPQRFGEWILNRLQIKLETEKVFWRTLWKEVA
jgi:hypothetical protein